MRDERSNEGTNWINAFTTSRGKLCLLTKEIRREKEDRQEEKRREEHVRSISADGSSPVPGRRQPIGSSG